MRISLTLPEARAAARTRRLAAASAIAMLAVVPACGSGGGDGKAARPDSAAATATTTAPVPEPTPLPAAVAGRARAVAATADGYVVAVAGPAQLVRFTADGSPAGEPVALPGEPVLAERTPAGDRILVATRSPGTVVVVDAGTGSVVETIPLDPAAVELGGATGPVSGEIRSVALHDGTIWAVTGGGSGAPALLRFRRPERRWEVATWPGQPAGLGAAAAGLRLRSVAGDLWAMHVDTIPSRTYRIESARVDTIPGGSQALANCIHDLAESTRGNPLLLSCGNELVEVRRDSIVLIPAGAWQTLADEHGTGRTVDETIVRDGNSVFVVLNTYQGQPAGRPDHARIARVQGRQVDALLDERGAAVQSMAVTSRAVIAVLRRADGTTTAVSVPRATSPETAGNAVSPKS